MNQRRRTGIALLAVFGFVAAACGSDSDTTSTTAAPSATSEPSATSPAPETTAAAEAPETTAGAPSDTTATGEGEPATGSPIVVGTVGTDQSDAVSLAQMADGLEAFADYINANGGLGGHVLQVNRCNDQLTPEQNQACARKHVDDKSVIAIAGSTSPLNGTTAVPIFAEAGLAYICGAALDTPEFAGATSFCTSSGALGGFVNLLDYLINKDGKVKFGFIGQDAANSRGLVELLKGITTALGGEWVSSVFTAAGAPDFTPGLTEVSSATPDVIFQGYGVQDEVRLLDTADNMGITIPFASIGAGVDASVLTSGKQSLENFTYNSDYPVLNTDDPEVKLFTEAMTEAGKTDQIGEFALAGWVTGRVFAAVVEAVGPDTVDRASFLDYILNNDVTGVPLFPTLSLKNPPVLAGVDLSHVASAATYIVRVNDGQPKIIDGPFTASYFSQ